VLVANSIRSADLITVMFMVAFCKLRRPDKIVSMIEEDLPARDLHPDGIILAAAMGALSKCSQAPSTQLSPDMKRMAHDRACQYLRRHENSADPDNDELLSHRVDTLHNLERDGEILAIYSKALAGQITIGPKGQAALIRTVFYLDVKLAVDIFTHHTRLSTFTAPDASTYHEFMVLLARKFHRSERCLSTKYSMFRQVMKLKPADVNLRSSTLGLILSLMLGKHRNNVKHYVDTVFDQLRSGTLGTSFSSWHSAMDYMLNHASNKHHANLDELLTAIIMLREVSEGKIFGATGTRVERMWETFFRHISTSREIIVDERRLCLDRAIDLYPKAFGPMPLHTYFSIIKYCLSRMDAEGRADEVACMEAMYRWEELKKCRSPVPASFWTSMLQALRRANRLDRAKDIVADAWNGRVKLYPSFWKTADALKLTASVGMREGEWRDEVVMEFPTRKAKWNEEFDVVSSDPDVEANERGAEVDDEECVIDDDDMSR